ncbi:MAG: rod shape-determining protein [Cyclobacteriaceae bacterium]|jgi:rod shape-determining protein MreB|nr:rod shape-determining protein [Cyclobacteriaceae bacterium]
MISFSHTKIAIDLGNENTLLADEQGIVSSQPSYIVLEEATHRVAAIGTEAYQIFEKQHERLKPVKPLRGGVIADYESARLMMREMVARHCRPRWWQSFDHVISGVPFSTTAVERRALREALDQFNARKTHLFFEPLAAATGMGLTIQSPEGKMVVDIGGGITEMVVIALSGIAVFHSTKVAGDAFTEAIRDYVRREHQLVIGFRTAEYVKATLGAVCTPVGEPASLAVKGKDVREGIPTTRTITATEIARVLEKPFQAIEQGIVHTLEVCPPELAADLYQNGIHITGGGALLRGIQKRLEVVLGLPIHLDPQPLLSVSHGIRQALREPARFKGVLID